MRKHIPMIVVCIFLIGSIVLCVFCIKTIVKNKNSINELNIKLNLAKEDYDKLSKEYDEFKESVNSKEEKVLPAILDESKMDYDKNIYSLLRSLHDQSSGISISIIDKKVMLATNSEAEQYFYYTGEQIQHEIELNDKKAVQVMICGYGSSCKAFILMEDGTLKYIEGNSIIKQDFTLHDVEGVEDVVRIQKALFQRANGGGVILPVAVKGDGTSKVIQ